MYQEGIVMLTFQDLRFAVNLIKHKIFNLRFPGHVILAVTNRCNLHCSYCYARNAGSKGPDIPTDKMFGLIDELFRMGTRYIVLTGGEPLLRPDIKTIIDHVSGQGMKCGMSTNGLLLEERLDVFENISGINISLDGNEQQHIKNRGAQDYHKVLKAIDLAVERNIPVSIGNVLTRDNMDCVRYIVEMTRAKGCLCYFHIPYWQNRHDGDDRFSTMTMAETSRVMREIIKYKKAGYPISYSNRMHAYLRDWPFPRSILRREEPSDSAGFRIIPCLAGDCYCAVDADSRVYPCASMVGQVEALKALDVGFRAAWNHLSTVRCAACQFFLQNELNLLFMLDPSTWLNFLLSWPHLLHSSRGNQRR